MNTQAPDTAAQAETALSAALAHLVPREPTATEQAETEGEATATTDGKPMERDTAFLMFKKEIASVRRAIRSYQRGGLSAVAEAAVLTFQMRKACNADQKTLVLAITGEDKIKETDSAVAKVYRGAMRIAGFWNQGNTPVSVAAATTLDDGARATLDWLAENNVRSLDSLGEFLSTGKAGTKSTRPAHERALVSLGNGVKEGKVSLAQIREFGDKIMLALGPKFGGEFLAHVNAANEAINKAALEAAARAAETPAALKTGTEG